MNVTFHTEAYEFSHGHTPRGRGSWAFEVTCETPAQFANVIDPQRHGVVTRVDDLGGGEVRIWTRSATYGEAKAIVKLFLRPDFKSADLTVCP